MMQSTSAATPIDEGKPGNNTIQDEQYKTNYYVSFGLGWTVKNCMFSDTEQILEFLKTYLNGRAFHDVKFMKIAIGEGYANRITLEPEEVTPPLLKRIASLEKQAQGKTGQPRKPKTGDYWFKVSNILFAIIGGVMGGVIGRIIILLCD